MTGEGIDVHMDELAYLALMTKSMSPRCIFEIGAFRGRTALNFANYGDYNEVTRAVLTALPGDQVIQVASTQLAVYRKP